MILFHCDRTLDWNIIVFFVCVEQVRVYIHMLRKTFEVVSNSIYIMLLTRTSENWQQQDKQNKVMYGYCVVYTYLLKFSTSNVVGWLCMPLACFFARILSNIFCRSKNDTSICNETILLQLAITYSFALIHDNEIRDQVL